MLINHDPVPRIQRFPDLANEVKLSVLGRSAIFEEWIHVAQFSLAAAEITKFLSFEGQQKH
jgi:hypothetical protein